MSNSVNATAARIRLADHTISAEDAMSQAIRQHSAENEALAAARGLMRARADIDRDVRRAKASLHAPPPVVKAPSPPTFGEIHTALSEVFKYADKADLDKASARIHGQSELAGVLLHGNRGYTLEGAVKVVCRRG